MTKILMIVSAAHELRLADGTAHPTGYWAEEVAEPHRILTGAGVRVDIATPGGRVPAPDAASLQGENAHLRDYLDAIDGLRAPLVLAEMKAADYDAVFLPGGHGPMQDLATDADLGALLHDANARHQPVAALCHGPAALLSTTTTDAGFAYAGRRLTVFTDAEERAGGLGDTVPYLVESRLRELGAIVEAGAAWSSTVVVDGTLVTGQNPQSSAAVAQALLELLQAGERDA
ncbi:dimethylallyltransferase [Virgisporangium aliadipatigenens]|uniref:Dimethylallyltransferase n=1 Tax=Virgisporangium aliadipatigenens TaxID=741659 RepID=A0A8J3YR45_9ACTN|nr:type 1 glutamine amidotransferase domain-containing protein [Virgisporangium aliadipatigenens]GIJ48248.1 dimethylallyltransferase [Virgisporangium aliadipatigenens]